MIDLRTIWDFADPAGSEQTFRDLLAGADDCLQAVLHTQIARAMGLQGRFAEGHAELDVVADPGEGEIHVRILLERGRLLNSAGEADAAIVPFTEAVDAARACGAVGLEIDALHMLAIADGEWAEAWNRRALARAEGSDDPEAKRWIGSLLNNLGWTLFDQIRLDESLQIFERAVVHREQEGAAEPIAIARWSVARVLRELGQLEAAEAIQTDLADSLAVPDPYVFDELAALATQTGRPALAAQWTAKASAARGQSST